MPEWAMQLLLAIIGAGGLTGFGVVYRGWQANKKAEKEVIEIRRLAIDARIERLQNNVEDLLAIANSRVEKLQDRVESLLADAVAREREANAQTLERIQMDAKQNEIWSAVIGALRKSAAALDKLEHRP